jgi:hypothetical protein
LVAGLFTRYNGQLLSAGEHYLIEARKPDTIVVRQPLGADTDITVRLPTAWHTSRQVDIQAFAQGDRLMAQFSAPVTAGQVTFAWQRQRARQAITYYSIVKPSLLLLPLLLK